METDFVVWLAGQIGERGWTQTELARRARVVPSYMSMVMNGLKRPSTGFCIKVATALGISPERVLRMGGYLPAVDEERLRQVEHVLQTPASLPEGPIREEAMAAIEAVVESAQRRAGKRGKAQQKEESQSFASQPRTALHARIWPSTFDLLTSL